MSAKSALMQQEKAVGRVSGVGRLSKEELDISQSTGIIAVRESPNCLPIPRRLLN